MIINETERSNHSQTIKIFQPKLLKLNKDEKVEEVKFIFRKSSPLYKKISSVSSSKDKLTKKETFKDKKESNELLENIEKLFQKHSSIINQKKAECKQNLTKETQIEIHPVDKKSKGSTK
jgi:hypothetical protein